jgi:hypothetical protein
MNLEDIILNEIRRSRKTNITCSYMMLLAQSKKSKMLSPEVKHWGDVGQRTQNFI